MRKNTLIAGSLTLILTACGGDSAYSGASSVDHVSNHHTPDVIVEEVVNAREKLDWAGTYQGILPCENCDGVSTMLVVKPDMSYTIRTQMLGIDLKDKVSNGRFHWLPDNSAIVLEGKEQMKVFRFYNGFGEFRLPNGDPFPARNKDQLQLNKTD